MEKGLSNVFSAQEILKREKSFGKKIKNKQIGNVMTDYWAPYEKFIPEQKHVQSKKETFTVEGYNSLFRHFLARLRRKSKCYTKKLEMLIYSVVLLMTKWNNDLAILN